MATSVSNAAPAESSPRHYGWRVVLAAHFGIMVSFGSLLVFTFSVFLKPVSAEFGWSREAVSSAFGFAAITVAVCSPLLGRWLDRYPARRVVLPCMALFGLAFASLSLLTQHLWHLYAVFVVMGIVGNGTTQMGYSRTIAGWFTERRGLALSLAIAGVGVGSIVFPVLAQAVITRSGWRAAYAVLGAIIVLLGIPLTALFLRDRPSAAASPREPFHDGVDLRTGLLSRAFWIIIVMLFLSSVSINGSITHLAALLTDRGINPVLAASAASVLGGTSFAARIFTGWLLDRFSGRVVAFLLMACSAIGVLLLSGASTFMAGLAAAGAIGIGLGSEAAFTPYLLTRYFGLRSFSTLYGITWTFYAFAGALGPIILGRAFDLTGSYAHLLLILSASTFAAAAVLLLLPVIPTSRG